MLNDIDLLIVWAKVNEYGNLVKLLTRKLTPENYVKKAIREDKKEIIKIKKEIITLTSNLVKDASKSRLKKFQRRLKVCEKLLKELK